MIEQVDMETISILNLLIIGVMNFQTYDIINNVKV